ncbi:MAG: type IX secretion system membrane protein PorP/SprF [Vicingaceae bacterium]|nr:type IX secretion system membrane protein PorP/SprF [Vicingaceae bacterium]
MKKILLLTLLMTGLLQAHAQQDPQYSLYMFNPLAVNPAYSGSREVLSAVLVHRSQWVGLDGAPETQAFAINTPLRNKKMGLGFQVVNDKIGPKTTQNITAAYAYRLKIGRGKLAFGLKAGIINYNFNWNKIEYKDEGDAIPEQSSTGFLIPTFDFGMYYNTRTLYAGIAAEHLNQSSFNFAESDSATTTSLNSGTSRGSKQGINFIGTVGKAFILNDNFVLKTSALVRMANESGNIDVSAGVLIKNKILFGGSLRSSGAIIFMTELNISKNLRMGIAYDVDGSKVASSTSGSFEVFLGYDVGLFKSKVVSPRYF